MQSSVHASFAAWHLHLQCTQSLARYRYNHRDETSSAETMECGRVRRLISGPGSAVLFHILRGSRCASAYSLSSQQAGLVISTTCTGAFARGLQELSTTMQRPQATAHERRYCRIDARRCVGGCGCSSGWRKGRAGDGLDESSLALRRNEVFGARLGGILESARCVCGGSRVCRAAPDNNGTQTVAPHRTAPRRGVSIGLRSVRPFSRRLCSEPCGILNHCSARTAWEIAR